MVKRYLLNLRAKVIHDREHLTERCNTDQIALRKDADTKETLGLLYQGRMLSSWRLCRWCYRS